MTLFELHARTAGAWLITAYLAALPDKRLNGLGLIGLGLIGLGLIGLQLIGLPGLRLGARCC